MSDLLIETRNLKKYFQTKNGQLHAVDGINLSIERGTTLGLVGESGCGKSTLGRVLLRLIPASSGQVLYNGEDILQYDHKQMLAMRKKMQMIFQDPFSSLNPRMSVGDIIAEPIKVCKIVSGKTEITKRILELMDVVGLSRRLVNAFPHELDGGRRQRIGIARALAVNPEFIVCDEPVSALDVSIQAQILNLLMDLQDELHLTYLFITHDLSVVKHISKEIAMLYLGQCVEKAPAEELFEHPLHPYTKALLNAIPVPDLSVKMDDSCVVHGEVTSPIEPAPGCRFAPRCPYAKEECKEDIALNEATPKHWVACRPCNTCNML